MTEVAIKLPKDKLIEGLATLPLKRSRISWTPKFNASFFDRLRQRQYTGKHRKR